MPNARWPKMSDYAKDGAQVLTVTVDEIRNDRAAVMRLAKHGPVAVISEGRPVAFLGVDSTPTVQLTERDEDQYTDNGAAQGETKDALLASVSTSYWGG